jgi:hypothetical protein
VDIIASFNFNFNFKVSLFCSIVIVILQKDLTSFQNESTCHCHVGPQVGGHERLMCHMSLIGRLYQSIYVGETHGQ